MYGASSEVDTFTPVKVEPVRDHIPTWSTASLNSDLHSKLKHVLRVEDSSRLKKRSLSKVIRDVYEDSEPDPLEPIEPDFVVLEYVPRRAHSVAVSGARANGHVGTIDAFESVAPETRKMRQLALMSEANVIDVEASGPVVNRSPVASATKVPLLEDDRPRA